LQFNNLDCWVNNKMKKAVSFFSAIIICQLTGFLGSFFTRPAIDGWYAGLKKPVFNPPNWLFAPVWTVLFLLMGISLFLVWSQDWSRKEVKVSLVFFTLQLLLNFFWSFIFFKLQSPLAALIEIIFLWLAILFTLLNFFQLSKLAGWLLLPYLLWVSFAGLLNFFIVRLN